MSDKVSFGIYGFEITRPIVLPGLELVPVHTEYRAAQSAAREKGRFNLTCLGRIDSSCPYSGGNVRHVLFDLEAALTLCEQQYVIVTRPHAEDVDALKASLPRDLDLMHPRGSPGNLIHADTFSPSSRREFLGRCLQTLDDAEVEQRFQLRRGLHTNAEIWRMREPFVDTTYYLAFSSLEGMSRAWSSDRDSTAEEVMTPFLRHCGFDFAQNRAGDRLRSMSTYCHLRNTLFHNGLLEAAFNDNGKTVTLRLTDYVHKLERIFSLVLLKIVGFDDGRINWDQWFDRQPFKGRT